MGQRRSDLAGNATGRATCPCVGSLRNHNESASHVHDPEQGSGPSIRHSTNGSILLLRVSLFSWKFASRVLVFEKTPGERIRSISIAVQIYDEEDQAAVTKSHCSGVMSGNTGREMRRVAHSRAAGDRSIPLPFISSSR